MKHMIKIILISTLLTGSVAGLSGCMGQMGLSQQAMGVNMKLIDNRYGRATAYLLLSPVYGIVGALDLFIFNSVEFWTGTNPITNKSPAVVDQKIDTWMKVNDSLDDSMTKVPVSSATLIDINNTTAGLEIIDINGKKQLITGEAVDGIVNFYLDGEFIGSANLEQLEARVMNEKANQSIASMMVPLKQG